MTQEESKRPYRVLIVDDNELMGANLENAFSRFSEPEFPPPEGVAAEGMQFAVQRCHDEEAMSTALRGQPDWDVFVIDRMFNDTDLARSMLESLRDLQVKGIRIVWTAFPDGCPNHANLIECMRLGAWDYIDKNAPRRQGEDAMTSVVASAIRGVRERDAWVGKAEVDRAGHQYVVDHYGEIYDKHKGKFVAFEKEEGTLDWRSVADDPSLVGLYLKLREAGTDRKSVHITLIYE